MPSTMGCFIFQKKYFMGFAYLQHPANRPNRPQTRPSSRSSTLRAPVSSTSSNSTMTLALPFSTILTSGSSSAPETSLSGKPALASLVTAWDRMIALDVCGQSEPLLSKVHSCVSQCYAPRRSNLQTAQRVISISSHVTKGYNTTPASSRRKTERRAYA
jgi:hypothetical protein